jgi:hypothetical protein
MPPHQEFDDFVLRAFARLPKSMRDAMAWLRHPSRRWVRIPAAAALIAGGVLWFLPLVGFWMLPLGLILLAEEIPSLKRPLARAGLWLEARWNRIRGR